MKEGIYEQVIYKDLRKKLEKLEGDNYLLEKESLDIEEARSILSNYTTHINKKCLRFI